MKVKSKTITIYESDEGFEFTFEPIEDTIKVKKTLEGFEARYLSRDDDSQSPREWDNVGTMVCWHNRYNLGDKHKHNSPEEFWMSLAEDLTGKEFEELEEMENKDVQKLVEDKIVVLPLYLYDHSGITMKTSPFGCRWDSGQVGYIYVTHDKLKKEEIAIEKANDRLIGEVEEYDKFLTGDVYIIIKETYNKNKEQIDYDCVSGFFGYDYALKELTNNHF